MARSMRGYFSRKLIYLAITIILIMSFNFILFRAMPGDPVQMLFGKHHIDENSTTYKQWNEKLGLDQPIYIQYIKYMAVTFSGDLGTSYGYLTGVKIVDILPTYIGKTIFLSGVGTVLAILVGIIYGREAAWRKGKLFDKVATTTGVILYSVPTFLFALLYIMIFAKIIPDWPFAGSESINYQSLDAIGKFLDLAQHAVLPILSLILESIAGFALIVRSSLIDVLTEDYILTAEAKGLEGRDILKKHAMPNALLPVVAVIALNVGWIMGGTVMIEYIFTYKGLGYLAWEAVLTFDYQLLQAVFFIEILAVLVANFIADILNFYLDPRVKI